MTVPANPNTRTEAVGNGVTVVFPFDFLCLEARDIRVSVSDSVLAPSQYSVSGLGQAQGGTVMFVVPPASGAPILMELSVIAARAIDYQDNGDLFADTVNFDFDRLWLAIKSAFGWIRRALVLGPYDVDGMGSYRANNNRIEDLGDPVAMADAVNKKYVVDALSNLSTDGSGQFVVERLADVLIPANGAGMVGFIQDGSGAIPQTVRQKLLNLDVTVEDFGAVGDGITDDSAALYAMHNAHGYIRLKRRTYYLGDSFFSIVGEKVCVIGEGKAAFNNATTQAVDGTGTILLGSLLLRADHMYCADFTVDVSRFATKKEGFVADAQVGRVGVSCVLERLGSIARTDADSSHGLLVEGFARHTITDVDVANHNYGVVSKSRDGFISRVRGRNIKTAVVYPKSSLPEVGGDVADASVNNIEIRDVQGRGGLSDYGCAVWIHAEGVNAVNIRVSGVYYLGGLCAVRVLGTSSAPYVVDCTISDVVGAQNSTAAVMMAGTTYDTRIRGVTADNPASGQAVSIDASSVNWLLESINLIVTDSAITGTAPATLLGSGQWDNFNVRNAFRTMVLATAWGTQRTGKKFGQIILNGEGNLTLSGGATTVAGEVTPNAVTLGDNMIALNGVIGVSGVTATGQIASTGAGINMGGGKFFICAAVTTSNTYTTFPVYVSGSGVSVFSVPSASNIKQIYLDSILVRR
ncbi:MAG: hypothetical protein ACN6PJ_30475 [Achromobacter sp.]|uniref:hypothetical protein n=1 Tax=Achromobacter sp. TaxID=134375 RepID=UPI003D006D87